MAPLLNLGCVRLSECMEYKLNRQPSLTANPSLRLALIYCWRYRYMEKIVHGLVQLNVALSLLFPFSYSNQTLVTHATRMHTLFFIEQGKGLFLNDTTRVISSFCEIFVCLFRKSSMHLPF